MAGSCCGLAAPIAAFTAIARRGRNRACTPPPACRQGAGAPAEDGGRRLFCFAMQSRAACRPAAENSRSEEHTSELQSLMRISYAVFCLKKKNKINYQEHIQNDEKPDSE